MTKETANNEMFFKYFLVLDQDVFATSRYVEFSKNNFNTFSLEYLRLLVSICAEFEIVCKRLCASIKHEGDFERADMDYLTQTILDRFPKIAELEIGIPQLGENILPFKGWGQSYKNEEGEKLRSPSWWMDYNHVKHGRDQNFKKSNLKNVLHSLAGLYGILIYLYRNESKNGEIYFSDMPKTVFYNYGNLFMPFTGGAKCVLPDFPAAESSLKK
jgi:hypothetical protein